MCVECVGRGAWGLLTPFLPLLTSGRPTGPGPKERGRERERPPFHWTWAQWCQHDCNAVTHGTTSPRSQVPLCTHRLCTPHSTYTWGTNNGQPSDASDADAINNAKCDAICETSQRQQQQQQHRQLQQHQLHLQQRRQQQQPRWQQIAAVKIALPQRRKGDCWPLYRFFPV